LKEEEEMVVTTRALLVSCVALVGAGALLYLALLATLAERWSGGLWLQLLLVALTGGAVMAGLRLAFGRSDRRPVVPDPFSRDVFSTDMINIAHVRVALAVAAQYQLTTAALLLGVCGGLIGAFVVIACRRVRWSGPPAGRRFFRL
jgi:hypothetical protein